MNSLSLLVQQFSPKRPSMRVALVTETYPPEINGVAMTIERMVQGLQRAGHHVQLIRPRQGAGDAGCSEERLEQVLRPSMPIPRYGGLRMGLPAKSALLRMWARKRPDVVHIATEGLLGWTALSAAQKLRIPVTSDFHTNFHSYTAHYGVGWLKKPIASYLRRFHNKSKYTLVPTQRMRDELEAQGYRNLEVVGRGVDTGLFNPSRRNEALRKRWGVGGDAPVAVYVGRMAPEKNLLLVAQAYRAMRQANPATRLVWVGDGPARAALQQQFPDDVFAGMQRGAELAAHYASADIFLFPSLTETFGNVTLEAMASGLAVVAYDYAAAETYIRHGDNGMVAEPGEADRFVDLARNLAQDRGLAERLRLKACSSCESMDWREINEQFEQLLWRAISDGGDYDREDSLLLEPN